MKKQDDSAVAGVFTRKPLFRALEQRIMFDAAAVDTAAQVSAADVTAEPQAAKDDPLLDQLAELVPPAERDSSRLVVVDQSVTNYDQLIAQIPEHYSVLVVSAGENGLERLAESLQFYNELDSIHILSHGSNDLFQLGDDQLTTQNIDQYADELGRIGQALRPTGDILLYGCDLAANEQGQSLLQQISSLTGADVAASDDATGASQLGGDWVLEQQVGEVETSALDLVYGSVLTAESTNEPQITADSTEVDQALGRNSLVARLSITNPQPGQSFVFSFSDGDGSHNNDAFSIDSRGLLRVNDASALPLGDVTVWVQAALSQGDDEGIYTVQRELTLTVVDTTAPKFRGDSDRTGNSSGFFGRVAPGMANGAAVGITVEMDRQDQGNVTFTLGDDADGRFQIDTDTGVVTIKDGSRFDPDVSANHDIVVVATDLAGNASEKTYGIQVKTAEGAARDDSGTTTQDRTRTGNVLSNDRDPDGNNNALTVVAVGGSADNVGQAVAGSTGGLFTIDADGSWIYDPNGEMAHVANRAVLETSIDITVLDSLGLESTSTLTIDVQGTNEKPTNLRLNDTTDPIEFSLGPTNRAVGVFTVDDVDQGDTHSYSINRDNSRAFEIVGNRLLVKEGVNLAPGTYSLTINARDNNTLIQQVFTINVVDNSAPVFGDYIDSDPAGNSDSAQGNVADGAIGGTAVGITATAEDASDITYSLSDDASGRFVIDAETGVISVAQSITISFADAPYFDITVSARDAFDNTSEQVYRVTVTDLPPVAVDDSVTTVENTPDPVTGDLLANDQNPAEAHDLLQVSGVNGSVDNLGQAIAGDNGGLFTVNADGTWSFTPDPAFNAMQAGDSLTTSVQITVADSRNSTAESTLSVIVHGEKDAPEQIALSGNTVALDGDELVIGRLQADDPDTGDLHSFTLVELDGDAGENAFFRINGDTLELVDTAIGTGTATVYIQARDTSGLTHIQTFEIRVTDTAILKITGDSDSAGNAANGQHVGLIKEGAAAGTEVGIQVEATHALDPEVTISFSLSDDAAGLFQIDSDSGVVTVAENATFDITQNRTHTVVVQASASDGLLVTARFVIGVVPDVLRVVNDSAETSEDAAQPISGNVVDNDPAKTQLGGPLTVTAVNGEVSGLGQAISGDNGGTFTINADGSWQFDPAGAFDELTIAEERVTTVSLTLSNALGDTSTSTLSVTVTGVADAPQDLQLDNPFYDVLSNSGKVGELSVTDPDSAADDVTFSLPIHDQSANHLFEIQGNALHFLNPETLNVGQVLPVYIEANDGEQTSGHWVDVYVRNSDVPLILGDLDPRGNDNFDHWHGVIAEGTHETDTEVGITVGVNHTEAFTYAIENAGADLPFIIDQDTGVISVAAGTTLNAEANVSYRLNVSVTDVQGDTASQVYRVRVENVAPDAADDAITTTPDVLYINGNVLDNDSDPALSDAQRQVELKVTAVNGNTNLVGEAIPGNNGGAFAVRADGVWVFAPGIDFASLQPGQSAQTSVTVTVSDQILDSFGYPDSDGLSDESVLTVTVKAPSDITLSENRLDLAGDRNAVGTLSADGIAGEGPFTFSLVAGVGGDHNSLFEIDSDTLNVVREPLPEPGIFSIRVKVSDEAGNASEAVFTVTLLDTDKAFHIRDIDTLNNRGINPNGSGAVMEGAEYGTAVGITAAPDQPRLPLTFSLSNDADGRFFIEETTGIVRVADGSKINAEDGDSYYRVTVKAVEAVTAREAEYTFTVYLDNVALNALDDSASINASASTPVGGNIFANDSDPNSELPGDDAVVLAAGSPVDNKLTQFGGEEGLKNQMNSLYGAGVGVDMSGSTGGIFRINSDGSWTFDPDGAFDSVLRGETRVTVLTVVVSDQGLGEDEGSVYLKPDLPDYVRGMPGEPSVIQISVTVHGEYDPDFTISDIDPSSHHYAQPNASGRVTEGAVTGSGVGIQYGADVDGLQLRFEMVEDADGRFAVDPDTGVVTVADASKINAEDGIYEYQIFVRATDTRSGKTDLTTSLIKLDNAPIQGNRDVAETTENGSLISGNLFANDSDPNSTLPGNDAVVLAAGSALDLYKGRDDLSPYGDYVGEGIAPQIRGSNGGFFTVSPDGNWTFDPNGEFEDLAGGLSRATTLSVLIADQGVHSGEAPHPETLPSYVRDMIGKPVVTEIVVIVIGENDAPVVVGESDPAFTISGRVGDVLRYEFNTAKIYDADANHTHENRVYALVDQQTLPPGLRIFDHPPRVVGIPSEAGVFEYRVKATDPMAASAFFTIRVEIAQAETTIPPVVEPPRDNTPPQRQDNAQPLLRDNLNPPSPRPAGLGGAAGGPPVDNLFGDNTAPPSGELPQLPELNLTFNNVGFDGTGDTGPDLTPRNTPQTPAQTPALAVDTTVPFDPAPFGPTAAGVERDNGSARGSVQVLLPDGQFIEPLPRSASLNDYVLDIGLNLENQLGLVDTRFDYEVPAAAFVFRSGGEMFVGEVSYRAVQVDGSPLPTWLSFNNRDALFTGVPGESDTETLQIRVIAESADGQQASAVFEIRVNEQPVQRAEGATDSNNDQAAAEDAAPHANDKEQIAGKAGLSEQLAHHAELENTAAEQQLLQQLAQFNFDQTPAS